MTRQKPAAQTALGIDVGGTSIKAVLMASGPTPGTDAQQVLHERRAPTPTDDSTGVRVAEAVTSLAAEVIAELGLSGDVPVGVVVPGVVDEARGVAVQSANLGFHEVPMRSLLSQRLGRPVAFGHDVRAGALAEHRSGAAAGRNGTTVFVPIGTGVSAAILVDGTPIVGGGWAGEIGQVLLTEGPHAGRRMEQAASASAIAASLGVSDARTVAQWVIKGDTEARRVWDEAVEVLADSFAHLLAATAPQTLIIGGGLAQSGNLLLDPLREALAQRIPELRLPELVLARHGDRAAALGAAHLALDLMEDVTA